MKSFTPYEWEPSNEEFAKKLGIRPEKLLRFDTNTSPFKPDSLLKELSASITKITVNEYPDTSYVKLRKALSEYNRIDKDQISVTTGADEALDIISKVLVEAGSKVLVSAPTYSMFRIVVETMGGRIISVPRRRDFSDDVNKLLETVDGKTSLIILCSPNNPTGNLTPINNVAKILDETSIPVVIDEAYFEFAGQTSARLLHKNERLIIVRTFSKAFSLAGARVGYFMAARDTVSLLNRMRPPNSLTAISLKLAELALKRKKLMVENVQTVKNERRRLLRALEKSGLEVYPSNANFILVRFSDTSGSDFYQRLLKKGFVARNVGDLPQLKNCLRFTIRTPKENDKLLDALKDS